MRLAKLLDGLGVSWGGVDPGAIDVALVTERSDEVGPGSLFIARCGEKTDARRFIPDAVKAGASCVLSDLSCPTPEGVCLVRVDDLARVTAVVAERFFGEPSRALKVAGITGTNGKTTVAHAIRHILNQDRRTCGLIGTVETDDGVSCLRSKLTTPFAIDLSRGLRGMVDAGCTRAVVETSSHALSQGRVAAIGFDVGVFTNLSGDHQDFHGSMEAYADAKAILFAGLDSDGVAIVNADDPWCERVVGGCGASVVRCSAGAREPEASEGDVASGNAWVRVVSSSLDGLVMLMAGPFGTFEVRSSLIGSFNAMNLLQASCAAYALGASREQICLGLASFGGVRGRLERVSNAPAVFVDFAHTDDALRAAIEGLRRAMREDQRLIVVFGCGGDRDRTKRARMGRAACAGDVVYLTSDNPRTEDPMRVIEDVREGMDDRAAVFVEPDRRDAIFGAIREARAEDVVLLAGKGHELEQIVPDGNGGVRRIAFDDAEVAREAVGERDDGSSERTPVVHVPAAQGSAGVKR